MEKFLALPDADRKTAFQEAASRRDVLPIIVEKDFWVCWTLKQLYSIPALGPHITFKGGTSLSKAFGLIERFSEDIDLTISKAVLDIAKSKDPMEENISGKELERRLGELKAHAQSFVAETILPKLHDKFSNVLGTGTDWKLELDNEDKDQQTILFFYPKILEYNQVIKTPTLKTKAGTWKIITTVDTTVAFEGYIKPAIRLEFGARGDIIPSTSRHITSYIAETFPQLFQDAICAVPTLDTERTFWEKATILHAIHHGSKLRDRMSRHYYDTYILAIKAVADLAIKNVPLLEQVVLNKSIFFKDNKASYETAKIGSLKLLPPDSLLDGLRKDYDAMHEMFIGEVPEFEVIIATLTELENKINNLSS